MQNAPQPVVPDDPNEKPYPGYARELRAIQDKIARHAAASAEPFPGPLLEAFVADPVKVHGFTLQPVTLELVIVLKKIESPLLAVMKILREEIAREDGADESTPELAAAARAARVQRANERMATEIAAEDERFVETVFCFVKPVAELRAWLRQGRERFTETALQTIGSLPPAAFAELQQAVSAHYVSSFATAVQYEAPKGQDDGSVFTPPPAAPKTVSAGGSTSTAS